MLMRMLVLLRTVMVMPTAISMADEHCDWRDGIFSKPGWHGTGRAPLLDLRHELLHRLALALRAIARFVYVHGIDTHAIACHS